MTRVLAAPIATGPTPGAAGAGFAKRLRGGVVLLVCADPGDYVMLADSARLGQTRPGPRPWPSG